MVDRKPFQHLQVDREQDRLRGGRENPIDARVGSRIRTKRILLGYSSRLFSEALGVSVGQLIEWESGSNRVGAERLKEISEILLEPPSAFFEDAEADRASSTANRGRAESDVAVEWGAPSNLVSSAEILELFWAFSRIADAEARKKLIAFAVAQASEPETRN